MGSQHLRVPYGLIRALCYPAGIRLPQVKFKMPEEETEVMAVSNFTQSYTPHRAYTEASLIVMPETAHIAPRMGNLGNESYRFFKGSIIKSSDYYQCRGCLQESTVRAAKGLHMRDCRGLIQAMIDRIKRDKVCVICNLSSQREHWGIPLCSDTCIVKWRFFIPDAWLIARRFVLAAEPSLLRIKI